MGCVKCEGGYWICTEGTADCDDGPAEALRARWDFKSYETITTGGTYYVQCKPGQCDAKLALQSGAAPGWFEIGFVHLKADTYALYCRTGKDPGGGSDGDAYPCDVAIKSDDKR